MIEYSNVVIKISSELVIIQLIYIEISTLVPIYTPNKNNLINNVARIN